MKIVIRLFALLCLLSTQIQAQTVAGDRPSPAEDLARLTKTYTLDATQQKAVQKLLERREAQYAEIQSIQDLELRQRKIAGIRQGAQSSFARQLSPAQYEVFKKEQIRLRKARAATADQLRKQGVSAKAVKQQSNPFEF